MTKDRILLLEDRNLDARAIMASLEASGYGQIDFTSNENDYVHALQNGDYCAIVADHCIPDSEPQRAIELAQKWQPGVPVICMSGVIDEKEAALLYKCGAIDYIGKDQLWRLPFALKRATGSDGTAEDCPDGHNCGGEGDTGAAGTSEAERIELLTKQLEAAREELRTLSYCIAHDLKSPLHSIHQITQLMLTQDNLDLGECRTIFTTIGDDALRMADMVAALLKLYSMSLHESASEEVDLSAMANTIVAKLRDQSPGRRVEVTIEPGLKAKGDPLLLECVVENLLSNSWKFTSRAVGAEITFGKMHDTEMDIDKFFVKDNGAGFDMHFAGKLYKPFQRLHTANDFAGLGMGLATVNRIIKRYEGRIWEIAAKGEGATFYFTLPS